MEINCLNCNKIFKKMKQVKNHKFCCLNCKNDYYKKNPQQETVICTNCNKEFTRKKQKSRYKNIYCSLNCEKEYKYKINNIIKQCEICDTEFTCTKSSTKRFCSIQCQGKWQSTQIGILNPRFKSELIKCDWCENEYYEKQYVVKNGKNHFCSKDCRQSWYSKVWSQQEEWKRLNRINTVKLLEEGHFSRTNTECQKKVNHILNNINIKFTNEKNFKYFSIDNYLDDLNLCIEVMGTFWHCDHRFYSTINYEMQAKRIRIDKIKRTYIKKYHSINILYLWEYDILNKIELCENLIRNYIDNNGNLNNYHSFNYEYINNQLICNDEIQYPYMDYHRNNIKTITDTTVKEKMSQKQFDKWIVFNCEFCGKEKEELITHYNKKAHHFCSQKCYSKSMENRVLVNCKTCNSSINIKISLFNKNKHKRFFCNQHCQHIYQKTVGFKTEKGDKKIFICEYCGSEAIQKNSDYNKSKHHYCSKKCYYLHRTKK